MLELKIYSHHLERYPGYPLQIVSKNTPVSRGLNAITNRIENPCYRLVLLGYPAHIAQDHVIVLYCLE